MRIDMNPSLEPVPFNTLRTGDVYSPVGELGFLFIKVNSNGIRSVCLNTGCCSLAGQHMVIPRPDAVIVSKDIT